MKKKRRPQIFMVKRHLVSNCYGAFFIKRKNIKIFVADKRTVISFAEAGSRKNGFYFIRDRQLIVARRWNQNAFGQNGWDIFKAVNSADFFGQILKTVHVNPFFGRCRRISVLRLATRERRERSIVVAPN